jgi:hypothetical protein
MKSTHIPESSGGNVTFTGSTTVDTELRHVSRYFATLVTDSVANCATLSVALGSDNRTLTIKAYKADGVTSASTECTVNWGADGI